MAALAVVVPDEELEKWRFLTKLVVDGLPAEGSKIKYAAALADFWAWWRSQQPRPPFSKALIQAFRSACLARGLSSSTVNVRLSALRKLAMESADNGLLDGALAAGIGRVSGVKKLGVRTGNWLSLRQGQTLLSSPDTATLKGRRDRAILAVLLGCGLRRSEVASLTLAHIQQRDGHWCVVDLIGKGGRVRTVPAPAWVKAAIDDWTSAAGLVDGRVFRAVNRGDIVWGDSISEKVIWQMLQRYTKSAGVPGIAPHDCRRSCAKFCRSAGGELEQIQLLLGHASVQTTERYLGTRQDLMRPPNDAIKLHLEA